MDLGLAMIRYETKVLMWRLGIIRCTTYLCQAKVLVSLRLADKDPGTCHGCHTHITWPKPQHM